MRMRMMAGTLSEHEGAGAGVDSAETMLQRIACGLPASAGAVTLELGRAALREVGGGLSVERAPGAGTCMRVWLPGLPS